MFLEWIFHRRGTVKWPQNCVTEYGGTECDMIWQTSDGNRQGFYKKFGLHAVTREDVDAITTPKRIPLNFDDSIVL